MKVAGAVLRSFSYGVSRQFQRPPVARHFSALANAVSHGDGDRPNSDISESADDFERRIFAESMGGNSRNDAFFQRFDRLRQGVLNSGDDDVENSYDTLDDGMDDKLKREATYFEYDPEEVDQEDYTFRPDVNFQEGMTYDVKDLDLRKPGVWKPVERQEFTVTTEEVLKKADFRNVRFLANFITAAGIINKRSQTGISAKAQRKIAREIKTARAFGLMPFTCMGTKSFAFGKSMEHADEDYQYEVYDGPADDGFDAPDKR